MWRISLSSYIGDVFEGGKRSLQAISRANTTHLGEILRHFFDRLHQLRTVARQFSVS
jgi:hypothetical protein